MKRKDFLKTLFIGLVGLPLLSKTQDEPKVFNVDDFEISIDGEKITPSFDTEMIWDEDMFPDDLSKPLPSSFYELANSTPDIDFNMINKASKQLLRYGKK